MRKKSVTLVEYGDYECPHCASAHSAVQELQAELGDLLNFEFKNFPLVQLHPHALMAAEAAEAARSQGQFQAMHDALFENQSNLDGDMILEIASQLDLNFDRFVREWSEQRYRPLIEQDVQEGLERGVQGTPTFFINDEKFEGQWSFDRLDDALRSELPM